ncbi:protein javelin [Sabethes cyaneus]|uniref:protein javelin n=1 Tax=Sabethes cyaneus TaxID=53552 RepID=UPI00237EC5D9|nr:protein javelin [Sabethes cyaneus]
MVARHQHSSAASSVEYKTLQINSDSASNYVDRVRIRDSSSSFGGPGRGSGWRQKSLSNIDLPTSYRGIAGGVAGTGGLVGAGQFRYRDYDSGLYDLYSRIDSCREEYDDIYGINPKASRAASNASSGKQQRQQQEKLQQQGKDKDDHHQHHQHQRQKHHHHHHHRYQEFYNPESNEACSLRRTRSLAVIREESYNDLHLHGRGARRSQLIPRAKLVDRNFFKDRYNFIYDDGEGPDIVDNETNYTLAKRYNAQGQPFPWHTDKSDLDSIDSSIFKHSLHQQNSFEGSQRNSIRSGDSTKFVSKVEVHSDYSGASKSETGIEADLKLLDDISLKEEPRTTSKSSTLETIKNRYPLEKKFAVKEEEESGITIIEIKDSQVSHKSSSVISYDSIYLSSESDEKEVLDEILPEVRLAEDSELIDIKIEDYDDLFKETDLEKAESTIDTLYGQVTKPKPKIVGVEPKIQPNDSLKRYIKNTSRGTIERLSLISNLKLRQEFAENRTQLKEKPLIDNDYQYNSLPDAADVCKILRNSERIDAKLRRICDNEQSGRSTRADGDHFDSLPRLDKNSLNLTQPPSDEDTSLEESDKGAPSIEVVETPTKEVLSSSSSKVYLKDYGVELDYENSLVTNSDQDSDITIVAPQDATSNVPAIVVTPAEKSAALGRKQSTNSTQSEPAQRQEPVIYSTFASTVGKQTTNRINFESKEKSRPNPEAIEQVKTKLKPIPVVAEQQKIPVALAPTVKLGGKKVIVDEVAAKAAKRERELEQINKASEIEEKTNTILKKPTTKKCAEPPPAKKEESKSEPLPIVNSRPPDPKPPESKEGSPKVDHSSLFKDTNPFKEQARREVKNRMVDRPLFKGVRRFNSTENIYTSAPIIVTKTFNNFIKTNEVKTKSFDSLIVESKSETKEKKMPRPQVIQIIDSKQNHHHDEGTLRKNVQDGQQVQKEFLHKVDSVRSYWSKMLEEADARAEAEDQVDNGSLSKIEPAVQQSKNDDTKADSTGSSTEQQQKSQQQHQRSATQTKPAKRENSSRNKYSTYQFDEGTELQSFSPTVEIIELEGQKQAALVKPKNANNLDFDHVRYKVMKSEMFQKNLLVNHRKAAQFDGLMQYLQDYSFQELLAHNNVVIIEPVRTKIEKISDKPPQSVATTCRITTGALSSGENRRGSGLKTHFFYHPIRVNKELLDEELPSPDTVRNVRKLFEGTLRLGTTSKQVYEDAKTSVGIRKWDSASLSSGVSSGDLSSPCECGENEIEGYYGEENLIGDDELESHYVSQDVLEKIRECGSTVTYYGGRVVDKKGEHVSTMTKAIMKEIRGQERKICQVCQPQGCRAEQRRHSSSHQSSTKLDGLGVKFKLVKSNSCSSRLELAGTGKTPPDLVKNQRKATNAGRPKHPTPNGNGVPSPADKNNNNVHETKSAPSPTVEEPEETVRDLVSRLENNTLSIRSKPRIIESKCIEKTDESKAEPAITINSLTTEVSAPVTKTVLSEKSSSQTDSSTMVTVNNHSTVPGQLMIPPLLKGQKAQEPQSAVDRPPKVCRNKNVDLAFAATINKANNKPDKEKQNLARRSSLATNSSVDTVDSLETAPSTGGGKTVTFHFQNDGGDDENNNNNNEKSKPTHKRGEVEQHENLKPSVIAEQRKSDELTSPKLVNWSSIGKGSFDERQYFANDKKLIEKRKYDEMEFEEFEVLDPNAPPVAVQQQHSVPSAECYDSLNGGQ